MCGCSGVRARTMRRPFDLIAFEGLIEWNPDRYWPFRHKANGAFHGSKSRSRLRRLRPSVGCCRRSGADDPPPHGDSIDHRVRLLLVRGEACAANRFRRHHRRRHAADQHTEWPPAGGRASGEDPGLAQGDRGRGDGRSSRARRAHPHRSGVCRRRAARRCARGEDPVDRVPDRLWLQRLQWFRAGELRSDAAGRRFSRSTAEHHDVRVRPGDRDSSTAVLRQHGRRARRPNSGASAATRRGGTPAISTTASSSWAARCYIPVFVPGALFEIGDGHAAQGDGEVDQTAIETSLRGRVQLTVRKDMKLTWPRAETPTDYISMATDPDLAVGDEDRDSGDGRLSRRDEEAHEARGLSTRQHRRQRRGHAARRQAERRRPREDAQVHLQVGANVGRRRSWSDRLTTITVGSRLSAATKARRHKVIKPPNDRFVGSCLRGDVVRC